MVPSPVKATALTLDIPVFQPPKLTESDAIDTIRRVDADLGIVVAYGKILRPEVLRATRLGYVNIHGSLLPKYRGAAPVQRAMMAAEIQTGVSIMHLDEGMDTGAVYCQSIIDIQPEDSCGTLLEKLAISGSELLVEKLPDILSGSLSAIEQDHSLATYAPMLSKQDGRIDWSLDCRKVWGLIQGVDPWPGAQTTALGNPIKVYSGRVAGPFSEPATPGQVLVIGKDTVTVACGVGAVTIGGLQAPGKRRVPAASFLHGLREPVEKFI